MINRYFQGTCDLLSPADRSVPTFSEAYLGTLALLSVFSDFFLRFIEL